jgi:hypothetical protein
MFNQQDFQEHSTRLSVIIMDKMNKPILTSFRMLTNNDKIKFNKLLNQYINDLPQESWKDNLMNDFNLITEDKLFNESFDPSKLHIPIVSKEE